MAPEGSPVVTPLQRRGIGAAKMLFSFAYLLCFWPLLQDAAAIGYLVHLHTPFHITETGNKLLRLLCRRKHVSSFFWRFLEESHMHVSGFFCLESIPKPSLKIRTASAIFWIYLGIFRDYNLKNIFLGINLFCFSR